ncbi:hypothetical protein NSQ59_27565 [Margalitia sp. FSL K6-0131]
MNVKQLSEKEILLLQGIHLMLQKQNTSSEARNIISNIKEKEILFKYIVS